MGFPCELHTLQVQAWRGHQKTPAPLPLPTRGQEPLISKTERGDAWYTDSFTKISTCPQAGQVSDLPATGGDFLQSRGHNTRPVLRARLPASPAPQGCRQQEQGPVKLRCIAGSWSNGSGPRLRPGSEEVSASSVVCLDLDDEISPLRVCLQGGTPAPRNLHAGWLA